MKSTFFRETRPTNATPISQRVLGFKSNVIHPQNEKLTSFENGLREELNKIKSCRSLLVFADKTTNLYEIPPDIYETLRPIGRPIPTPKETSTKKPKSSPKRLT